ATIIAVRGGMYTILSTSHAHDLTPGNALDKVIYTHFSAEFKKKTKLDTEMDARARMKLILEAESVKKSLSASANASVESLMDGLDFKSTINRIRFDMLARKIYQQIADFALEAVKKASLEPIDIDDVPPLHIKLILGSTSWWYSDLTKSIISPPISIPLTNNNPSYLLQPLRTSRPRRSNPSLPNILLRFPNNLRSNPPSSNSGRPSPSPPRNKIPRRETRRNPRRRQCCSLSWKTCLPLP